MLHIRVLKGLLLRGFSKTEATSSYVHLFFRVRASALGWWTSPSGATPTVPTPSASPTRSSRWPSTKSRLSPSKPRVGGGKGWIENKILFWNLVLIRSDTTVSSRASEVSPSPFWGRRLRPPRSWSSGWSAPSASGRTRWAWQQREKLITLCDVTIFRHLNILWMI